MRESTETNTLLGLVLGSETRSFLFSINLCGNLKRFPQSFSERLRFDGRRRHLVYFRARDSIFRERITHLSVRSDRRLRDENVCANVDGRENQTRDRARVSHVTFASHCWSVSVRS